MSLFEYGKVTVRFFEGVRPLDCPLIGELTVLKVYHSFFLLQRNTHQGKQNVQSNWKNTNYAKMSLNMSNTSESVIKLENPIF